MFYEAALTVEIFSFTSLPSLVYSISSGLFYLPASGVPPLSTSPTCHVAEIGQRAAVRMRLLCPGFSGLRGDSITWKLGVLGGGGNQYIWTVLVVFLCS